MNNAFQRTTRVQESAEKRDGPQSVGIGFANDLSARGQASSKSLEARLEDLVRSSERLNNEMLNLIPRLGFNDLQVSRAKNSVSIPRILGRNPSEQHLRNIVLARRQRDCYFNACLFADPAWDILLDLALAEISQVRVCVSDLCVGANVPATTALRWIKRMTEDGLLERVDDPFDARRKYVELSHTASAQMQNYLESIRGAETPDI